MDFIALHAPKRSGRGREDRRLNFYRARDNLADGVPATAACRDRDVNRTARDKAPGPGQSRPTARARKLGLATGDEGFNLDFHAIRHHGTDTSLEKHYVSSRSQRTRAMLTFFAQDHASQEMVYSSADLTKTEQAREVLALPTTGRTSPAETPGCSCSTPS
jgi:hypothetical protein